MPSQLSANHPSPCSHIWNSDSHVARLKENRLENHKFFKLPGEPKPLLGPSPDTAGRSPVDANLSFLEQLRASLDETAGANSFFMFDVGSPDFSADAQLCMIEDPYFAQLANDDGFGHVEESQYASGGRKPLKPGKWYAIAGGEFEGAYFARDFDTEISHMVVNVSGAKVFGSRSGIHTERDALDKVESGSSPCAECVLVRARLPAW